MSTLNENPTHRILVIDDNPTIHEDFRKILCPVAALSDFTRAEAELFGGADAPPQPARFEIDSAYQGQEGLELVERAFAEGRQYSLAFVDVRMPPGWDGVETIGQIWRKHPELQVVICTAFSDYSWAEIVGHLGESDNMVILKKPFDNVEVLQLAFALTRKWIVTRQANARMADLDDMVRRRTTELEEANAILQEEIRQRARIQDALRLSEERFSKAFQASPIPMAIQAARDERYLDVNEGFLRMTGFGRDAVLQRTPMELQIWPGPLCDDPPGGEPRGGQPIRDLRRQLRTRAGGLRETLVAVEPLTLGHEPCLLVIVQDRTEQLNLENRLRQSQKMEAVGQLAAGVAHDFNNILTVIQGHAELQLASEKLDHEVTSAFEEVLTASRRASALTRQLLVFSRKQITQPRRLNLNDVFRHTQKMLARLIGEHIALRFEPADNLPSIRADEANMEQVLMNLTVNARDAMPSGGCLTLQTRAVELDAAVAAGNPDARPGKFVCLTVTDTGCGMDTTVISRIFEPFFTTKAVGKGTGLGLSTVYGIVKQHEGWIEVSSGLGRGTTFNVFLPQSRGADGEQSGSTYFVRPSVDRGGQETVLVVEDEPAVRRLVCVTLRRNGYTVHEAPDGVEARDRWADSAVRIDLLLTDMVMPNGVSGRELARQLRVRRPALKVVYTSGYSPEFVGGQTELLERVNFLPKPYDPKLLVQTVRNCLDSVQIPSVMV